MVSKFILGNTVLVKLYLVFKKFKKFFKNIQRPFLFPIPLLNGIGNETVFFKTADELIDILLNIDFENLPFGLVVFVDEITVIFKDIFYNPRCADFITFLTQLRKLGIYFIGTSQLYSKCDKVVRDYFRTNGQIVFCVLIFPGLTLQKFVDMSTCVEDSKNNLVYDVSHTKRLYHTPELYDSYDTFAIVSQIKNIGKKGVKTLNGN